MKHKTLLSIALGAIVGLTACTAKKTETMEYPRGEQQVRALWTPEDGTQEELEQFIADNTCKTDSERIALFESLSKAFENLFQSADMLTVELLRPTQLTNAAEPQTPDWILSGYSPLAHFSDDMFANKLAFLRPHGRRVYYPCPYVRQHPHGAGQCQCRELYRGL